MSNYICVTCGVQYAETAGPPGQCAICEDSRQYVGFGGQQWTTIEELKAKHRNIVSEEEPRVTTFVTDPKFAIGQRCFLIESPAGNVLWESLTLIDDASMRAIRERGGVTAIAVSHPHYYSCCVEWSRALGGVPVYLHADDRQWVQRPDACIEHWQGESKQIGEFTLVRCGGHFDGGTVLHWPPGADGRGVLFPGDILQIVPDRKHFSFMYSYPNWIPLNAAAVNRAVAAVAPFAFDRAYGIYPGLNILSGAKDALERSRVRYLRAIGAELE